MVLAIHHKKLPPTLHEGTDPKKRLAEKGIHIQSALADWNAEGLRCAGVSSFGFGGTNAHLILQEPGCSPVFHPAPNSIHARKNFFYDFFPELLPRNEAVAVLDWEGIPLQIPQPAFEPACWILLGFDQKHLDRLSQELGRQGKATAYRVLCGVAGVPGTFTRSGEWDFCIDPGNADHYRWLMAGFQNEMPLGILLMADGLVETDPTVFIRKVLSGFRFLMQSMRQRGKSKIWISTTGAYRVHAAEQSQPQQRALAVLAAGTLEENPELRGGLVDQGSPNDPNDMTTLASLLGVIAPEPLIIRGNRQFLPVLKPAGANSAEIPDLKIKPGGVYLIIGGSSGIGALLAEFISRKSARMVIVSGTRRHESLPQALAALIPDKVTVFTQVLSKKTGRATRKPHRPSDSCVRTTGKYCRAGCVGQ